jgi:hypothetical protein
MGNTSSYIVNEAAWNERFPSCANCFPKNILAELPCLPQCVFTSQGHGLPPIVREVFKNKKPPKDQKPTFIIAYGPSGSGKSGILRFAPQYKSENVIEVNVDKLFQSDPEFKREMSEISTRSPDPLYAQRLYQYYRWTADQIADGILNQALLSKFHVLWETTGERIGWIERELHRINCAGYQTLLLFPLVSFDTLMARVEKRAKEEKQVPPSAADLAQQTNAAQENIVKFLRLHQCPAWVEEDVKCKVSSCNPNRIILVDNNNSEAEIVYDSADPDNAEHKRRFKKVLKALARNNDFEQFFLTNVGK